MQSWRSAAFVSAGLAFIASTSDCNAVPAAPPPPKEISALAAQYDAVSGQLDAQTARAIFTQTQPLQRVLRSFTGLRFFRDIIDDATSISPNAASALDVQGSIEAHSPCPGWTDDPSPDDATQGFIDVTIGVEETRVQRAFMGEATRCQFVTQQAGTKLNVVATMDLQVDLGGDIGLGETAPAILVRATNATGTVDGVALDLQQRVLSFRLERDGSIETLVDLTALDPDLRGSALLALRSDGTWSLRTRQGEWVCDAAGSAPCTQGSAAS